MPHENVSGGFIAIFVAQHLTLEIEFCNRNSGHRLDA